MAEQSKTSSLEEAIVNTIVGLLLAWTAQCLICLAYGIPLSGWDNLRITFWMTVVSLLRNYFVRRFFNRRLERADG